MASHLPLSNSSISTLVLTSWPVSPSSPRTTFLFAHPAPAHRLLRCLQTRQSFSPPQSLCTCSWLCLESSAPGACSSPLCLIITCSARPSRPRPVPTPTGRPYSRTLLHFPTEHSSPADLTYVYFFFSPSNTPPRIEAT